MRTSPASTSLPASPAARCTAAISTARSIPRCCGSCAPARCRRRRKSDLQQADIVILEKPEQTVIADLIPDQPFIRTAPAFLVFLANGRRLAEISKMRGKPFPNDHLDQFFNAAVDAGIVLATFLRAADAVGPGHLPDQRDPRPFAEGQRHAEAAAARHPRRRDVRRLAVGERPHQPAARPVEHAAPGPLRRRRSAPNASTPTTSAVPRSIPTSRATRRAGARSPFYGWSEDKARQYGVPQRADFGAFVRRKGFCLD